MTTLECSAIGDCQKPVTHIDNKGFLHCDHHGKQRKLHVPCRMLTKGELGLLQDGKPIPYRKQPKATDFPAAVEACLARGMTNPIEIAGWLVENTRIICSAVAVEIYLRNRKDHK
jgi:hypothetical protein